ncbi:MAG: thioredoxin domain-containing protein [Bryobacterales bacterium]|nr:thioredoxin domain-containing protein [Bryobacterales bacterium]
MQTNRLAREQSPYLLQHAHNPVDWYPWGEDAFTKAREENKPIFLSIGYSTCHWCHVMERESFESEETAAILNRHFVAVKVDREERPDVDRIYMTFVQATTGGGGWPMSVWLTPDLKPFFGGTYFPPDNRYGRPGFPALLEHIAGLWESQREKLVDSSVDVIRQLSEMLTAKTKNAQLDEGGIESCYLAFRRSFDARQGGFGQAPKFPRPVQFHFLHRYFAANGEEEALEMSLLTLREMYRGGMYDQLGGGFHRYSVDARWFVPHFEKMLYDQAQLAVSYLEAHQITEDPLYAQVARETFGYVLRDMRDAAGGFFSAEDADSVIDASNPKHKGEGAFYVFTAREIEATVRKPESDWFCYRHGARPNGNVEEDPHAEFVGKNILFQAHTMEETAQHFGVGTDQVARALETAAARLMALRDTRVRPHLDDKVLTAWNGLMISAFAKGAQVLGDTVYLDAAARAADFVLGTMLRDGVLLRRYRQGEAAIAGFLDDYAFFVQGLLDLYEASFDMRLLECAVQLTRKAMTLFEDPANGGFYSTAEGDRSLVLRIKDDYDGAEPASNSVMAGNLLRLSALTGDRAMRASAEKALTFFAGRLATSAITIPMMATAYLLSLAKPKQIVIAGERDAADTAAMLREVRKRFLPGCSVVLLDAASRGKWEEWMPFTKGMKPLGGQATAYVCEDYACQLPVNQLDEFVKLLQ